MGIIFLGGVMKTTSNDVLNFWFDPKNKEKWFKKSDSFDQEIQEKFLDAWHLAKDGLLYKWRKDLDGRCAEIIILDQFSRNMFRNDPRSFAQDNLALVLAQEAIKDQIFEQYNPEKRRFILMPFMHAEHLMIHEMALPLFEKYTEELTIDYEKRHKSIIERFNRYPHRNEILGRVSTPEEIEFLKEPGSSF